MLIRFGYDIALTCARPTPMVSLLWPHDERAEDIRPTATRYLSSPAGATLYRDQFGNLGERFVAVAGETLLHGDGVIEDSGLPDRVDRDAREVPVEDLPDDCLTYLLGSRYCDTDRLSQFAWDRFGDVEAGPIRVQAICDFVNQHITFGYENASATRTAFEANWQRVGVCRDYAHLAIALCRCLNIPARYVTGYLGDIGVPVLDPMDFSAWMEVYLGGKWFTFDPRNNAPRIGRIVVARGRDAVDVPIIQSFGRHVLKSFHVWTYDIANPPPAYRDGSAGAGG